MRRWQRRTLGIVTLVLLIAGAVAAAYPQQTRAYLTHWKGSPRHTVALQPPPPDTLVRLAVVGDVGDSGSRLTATGRAIARVAGTRPFDGLVLLGDNAYPDGDPEELATTVFGPFSAVLDRGTPLLAILGNHDVRNGNAPRQVAALGMSGRWWSREAGPVLVVGLDSNLVDSSEQRRWLEATLRSSSARWKIVLVHHPPYSAGFHGSNEGVRDAFTPLFSRYNVDLVLSGHDHDYQRSKPIDGVTYVVTGAAAGSRRTGERSFTAVSFSWHHFVELDITEDVIVGRAVNQDGRVADTWTLHAAAPDGAAPAAQPALTARAISAQRPRTLGSRDHSKPAK